MRLTIKKYPKKKPSTREGSFVQDKDFFYMENELPQPQVLFA
jgi:hypothetical protein